MAVALMVPCQRGATSVDHVPVKPVETLAEIVGEIPGAVEPQPTPGQDANGTAIVLELLSKAAETGAVDRRGIARSKELIRIPMKLVLMFCICYSFVP